VKDNKNHLLEDIFGNLKYLLYICIMNVVYIYILKDQDSNIKHQWESESSILSLVTNNK